jgi:hypothetical protein
VSQFNLASTTCVHVIQIGSWFNMANLWTLAGDRFFPVGTAAAMLWNQLPSDDRLLMKRLIFCA